MTTAILIERCKNLGLPIAKNAFAGTLDDPIPQLPYMIYLLSHERSCGADTVNNLKTVDFDLELYTAEDDQETAAIAKRIETEVLQDVDYEKYVAYIESEECYQTAYEVKNLFQKMKGVKHHE